jgi:hypothetical protein
MGNAQYNRMKAIWGSVNRKRQGEKERVSLLNPWNMHFKHMEEEGKKKLGEKDEFTGIQEISEKTDLIPKPFTVNLPPFVQINFLLIKPGYELQTLTVYLRTRKVT